MSINIKKTSSKVGHNSTAKSGASTKGGQKASSSNVEKNTADSIDLTATATQLQQIENSLADLPIIDEIRVATVNQSIKEGRYTIDNEKIADRIIASEKDIKKS